MKTDSSLSPPDDDNRGMVMLSLVIAAVYGAVVASLVTWWVTYMYMVMR